MPPPDSLSANFKHTSQCGQTCLLERVEPSTQTLLHSCFKNTCYFSVSFVDAHLHSHTTEWTCCVCGVDEHNSEPEAEGRWRQGDLKGEAMRPSRTAVPSWAAAATCREETAGRTRSSFVFCWKIPRSTELLLTNRKFCQEPLAH